MTEVYFLFIKVEIIFRKMLKRNRYFEIKNGVKYEALSDINYKSNYNKIFQNCKKG